MTNRGWALRNRYNNTSGFTIIELLIVVVVVGILATIVVVSYAGIQARTNDTAVQNDLRQSFSRVLQHEVVNGVYPTSQANINSTFVATRNSYGGGNNALLYCRSSSAVAIVGRSVSGKGFYRSSVSGQGELVPWPGDGNANLCPAAGIPTTSPGYAFTWIRVNGGWEPWFTPGA